MLSIVTLPLLLFLALLCLLRLLSVALLPFLLQGSCLLSRTQLLQALQLLLPLRRQQRARCK